VSLLLFSCEEGLHSCLGTVKEARRVLKRGNGHPSERSCTFWGKDLEGLRFDRDLCGYN